MLMKVEKQITTPEIAEKSFTLRALSLHPLATPATLVNATQELAALNQDDDQIATQSVLMGVRALWDETRANQDLALSITADLASRAVQFSHAAKHLCHEWQNMAVATPAASHEERFEMAVTTFSKLDTGLALCFKQAVANHIIRLSASLPETVEGLTQTATTMARLKTFAHSVQDHDMMLKTTAIMHHAQDQLKLK